MRFTRYSSDGNTVIQERILLRPQQSEKKKQPDKKEPVETRTFEDCSGTGARFASRGRVIAGIDELLRSTAAAA